MYFNLVNIIIVACSLKQTIASNIAFVEVK